MHFLPGDQEARLLLGVEGAVPVRDDPGLRRVWQLVVLRQLFGQLLGAMTVDAIGRSDARFLGNLDRQPVDNDGVRGRLQLPRLQRAWTRVRRQNILALQKKIIYECKLMFLNFTLDN